MKKLNKKSSGRIKAGMGVFPPVQEIEEYISADAMVDRPHVIRLIRESALEYKKRNKLKTSGSLTREQIAEKIAADVSCQLAQMTSYHLKRVVNGTGIILHTGLGRAPLSPEAVRHLNEVTEHYCNLEYDLESGARGDRNLHVEKSLCLLTGAESACVVNNNAAAVMIALNSLAFGREVVVSRGQLIEIGGSFRLPDVMEKSGVRIRETGTTNKTHLRDYARAIGRETGAVLVAHTSNYRVMGFTHETGLKDIADLCRKKRIPLIFDLGGGVMTGLERYGLPHEPVVKEAVLNGADIVTFSGDKLLGACQSGLIAGKKKYVTLIKQNPLMRALRCGKMTYAVLEATLQSFFRESGPRENHPSLNMLTADPGSLRRRAQNLCGCLSDLRHIQAEITDAVSQAGSGTLPLEPIRSVAVNLSVRGLSAAQLAKQLRLAKVPVIGYIKNNRFLLDMRTVRDDELPMIQAALTYINNNQIR